MGMIKNLWSSFNYHFNEAINFVLQHLQTLDDSQGREGQIAYHDGGVYVHNGTEWILLGGGKSNTTKVYDFSAAPSEVWTIPHNLGRYAIIQTMDIFGNRIEGTAVWTSDLKSTSVTFTEPMQGKAILSYMPVSQTPTVYDFTEPSDRWTLTHDLGRYVVVQTMTSDNVRVAGDIDWSPDRDSVTMTFEQPITGRAVIGYRSDDDHAFHFDTSDTWVIRHTLGRFAIIQTMDDEGSLIEGAVRWDPEDQNIITVTFEEPVAGTALLL